MGFDVRPTGKYRGQCSELVRALGSQEARSRFTYLFEHWNRVARDLKLNSPWPTPGLVLGFGETIAGLRDGKNPKPGVADPRDRVASSYEGEDGW
jgi:hypothetical protein